MKIQYDQIDSDDYLQRIASSFRLTDQEQERYILVRCLSRVLRLMSLLSLLALMGVGVLTRSLPYTPLTFLVVCILAADYAVYRYRAFRSVRAFVDHLIRHKRAGGIERLFSSELDSCFSEDECRGLPPAGDALVDRPRVPINFPLRLQLVRDLIAQLSVAKKYVLDVGALFGYFSERYLDAGNKIVSLDLYSSGLVALRRRGLDIACIVGNGRAMPLRSGTFDFVNCLEVIEHVANPVEVLREIGRVLVPGGRCLLTTDNLQELSLSALCNPFVAIERLASFFWACPLPMAATGAIDGYSTAYTKREVESFSRAAGLRTIYCGSYLFFLEGHVLIEKIFRVKKSAYARRLYRFEGTIRKLPMARWFGHHWVFILVKPEDGSSRRADESKE